MKKMILAAMAALALVSTSCNKDDNKDDNGGEPTSGNLTDILFGEDGKQLGNGNQEFTIPVGTYKLPKGTYTLHSWVYVPAGAELYIEPGTIIKGVYDTDASLIVMPGGKLYARGTKNAPIVFTSDRVKGQRKPGDWGGLILLGRARNNMGQMTIEGGPQVKHGGNDDQDSSGELSYVRVEFAGTPYATDQEINGITFGSVGSGTVLHHVQVSYSGDDSFEWFGGAVNAKYLVAYRGWDDDFDTDNGFSGKIQFCLGVRHPRIADQSVSNGFESDNNGEGSATTPRTQCVFSNVTFVGPIGQDAAFINTTDYINGGGLNPNNGARLGQFQAAMQIRRNSNLSCFNSVAMGYPVGIIIENDKGSDTQGDATKETFKLANNIFAGMTILGCDKNKAFVDGYTNNSSTPSTTQESFSSAYFKQASLNNRLLTDISDLKLSQPISTQLGADYRPTTGSPLLGTASFSNPMVASGFDKVTYVGAFAQGDTWLEEWTEFDPQNANY
ncbi:MAG: hypothetical protein RR318_05255 [Alistipes sp.]